jgi:hypothetical protein
MAIVFSLKYREGNNAKYSPKWAHSNKLEAQTSRSRRYSDLFCTGSSTAITTK